MTFSLADLHWSSLFQHFREYSQWFDEPEPYQMALVVRVQASVLQLAMVLLLRARQAGEKKEECRQ